ncbi:Transposable element Tc3 transposase [Anthophora quadrimaculata]
MDISELSFISGRLNATDYQNMLHNHLLPFITIINDNKVIFQQDNAPIHTASSTKKWFEEFGIKLLPWPAISPDLNPIENLWSILARKVYDQEKPQIQNVRELKNRIESAWADIPNDTLNRLIDSIPDRLLDVIKAKGKYTKY